MGRQELHVLNVHLILLWLRSWRVDDGHGCSAHCHARFLLMTVHHLRLLAVVIMRLWFFKLTDEVHRWRTGLGQVLHLLTLISAPI